MMTFMNKAIPCFDMTIGVLLIAGLFTRFAAMGAGAVFGFSPDDAGCDFGRRLDATGHSLLN